MVTLSWNSIFNAPRILEGAISERNTGTACHQIETTTFELDSDTYPTKKVKTKVF